MSLGISVLLLASHKDISFELLTVSVNCHFWHVQQQGFCEFESGRGGEIRVEMYIKYAGFGCMLVFCC